MLLAVNSCDDKSSSSNNLESANDVGECTKNQFLFTNVNPHENVGFLHNKLMNYIGDNADSIYVYKSGTMVVDTSATTDVLIDLVYDFTMQNFGSSLTKIQLKDISNQILTTINNNQNAFTLITPAFLNANFSSGAVTIINQMFSSIEDTTISPNTTISVLKHIDTVISNSVLDSSEKSLLFSINSVAKYSMNHAACLMKQKEEGSIVFNRIGKFNDFDKLQRIKCSCCCACDCGCQSSNGWKEVGRAVKADEVGAILGALGGLAAGVAGAGPGALGGGLMGTGTYALSYILTNW